MPVRTPKVAGFSDKRALFLLLALLPAVLGADWPQYQHDARRSGFTTEEVPPPYRVAWTHCFLPERPARRTQAVVYGGEVFVGTHGGRFLALDQESGRIVWAWEVGAPIFNTAAFWKGRVYFGAEDLRVYCLDASDGSVLWKGGQLWGISMRDYCPVVHKGYVIVRPMAAFEADIYTGRYSRYGPWPRNLPGGWWPVWGDSPSGKGFKERYAEAVEKRAGKMPPRLIEARRAFIRHFREMPEDQDMFVLDAPTGKQAFIPPHFRVQSMHGPVTPPAEDRDGYLIVPWVHINHCWARYDIKKNLLVEFLIPPRPTNADENLNVSCGGRYVYVLHCEEGNANYTGVYNLDTKQWTPVRGVVKWYDNKAAEIPPRSPTENSSISFSIHSWREQPRRDKVKRAIVAFWLLASLASRRPRATFSPPKIPIRCLC